MASGRAAWARNPSTGDCCGYVTSGAAPGTWPLFDSEDACQNDCRCPSARDGKVESRTSLECICSVTDCPATVAEAEQRLCSAPFPPEAAVQRLVGCRMVMVIDRNGYSGAGWIFEQPLESTDAGVAAPQLVGSTQFSDATGDACIPELWLAGRDFFECEEEVVACQLCGASPGPEVAPCD